MKTLKIPEPICMMCGKKCEVWEVVKTDDVESVNGEELWCYYKECDIETFHQFIKKTNLERNEEEQF